MARDIRNTQQAFSNYSLASHVSSRAGQGRLKRAAKCATRLFESEKKEWAETEINNKAIPK